MQEDVRALEANGTWTMESLSFGKKALDFALVEKMVDVQTFLVIVVSNNSELHQMDVHTAFMHGNLVGNQVWKT
ncbi:Retrovirus-related Pol polyprotein from transposon TNT 1-94 [Gossypium australe]|uniref:Retrovirus-related Pol polyprotein from transposon TNT 1-94 n=1 Tax=Gossypium australe TaxID=47621 RepID=A0A5B6VV40_9ROSI|nr:Retrovirus-related Pol polyprotein from transposon TNT 1-94 [Gossypium australe]